MIRNGLSTRGETGMSSICLGHFFSLMTVSKLSGHPILWQCITLRKLKAYSPASQNLEEGAASGSDEATDYKLSGLDFSTC